MNDLDLLKDLRRATPEITPAASADARDRLAAEWAPSPVPVRLAFPRGRMAARVVLAGAMSVTLAGGIAAVQMSGDPGRSGTSVANAAAFGDRAARAVEAAPYTDPGPHKWIYSQERAAQFKGDMNTWWLGMDTAKVDTIEEWERVDAQGTASLTKHGLEVRVSGQERQTILPDGSKGDKVMFWSKNPDMYQVIKKLPTEPDALLRALYDPKTIRWPSNPSGPMELRPSPDDRSVFATAADLLRRPLPPKLRAALFRALSRIGGVTLQHHVKDAAGRAGVAFAISSDGWSREMIILDPRTYRFLGTYSYAFRDHREGAGLVKKGTVLRLTAEMETRVVDKPGQRG